MKNEDPSVMSFRHPQFFTLNFSLLTFLSRPLLLLAMVWAVLSSVPVLAGEIHEAVKTGNVAKMKQLLARVPPEEEELRKRQEEAQAKLANIIIPKIEFKNASFTDALSYLTDGSHWAGAKQSSGVGVSFVLGGDADASRITLSLRNVTLSNALWRICDMAGFKFHVDARGLLIVPANYLPACTLPSTRSYKIQPAALEKALSASHTVASSEGLKRFFMEAGVPFPGGASVTYTEGHLLFVTNSGENLDALEDLLAKLNILSPSHHLIMAIQRELARGTGKALLRQRGLRKETGEIEAKLEGIVIPKIELKDVSLADAVKFMVGQSREIDGKRGGSGVRIELDDSLIPVLKDTSPITLNLMDVPLRDAMRYVTDIAGVAFQIKPGKVVILPANWRQLKGAGKLVTRSYKWKRDLLVPHLGAGAGAVSGQQIKELLTDAGVEFPTGASLAYNESSETLTITNSLEALDVFEQILALLDATADGECSPKPDAKGTSKP